MAKRKKSRRQANPSTRASAAALRRARAMLARVLGRSRSGVVPRRVWYAKTMPKAIAGKLARMHAWKYRLTPEEHRRMWTPATQAEIDYFYGRKPKKNPSARRRNYRGRKMPLREWDRKATRATAKRRPWRKITVAASDARTIASTRRRNPILSVIGLPARYAANPFDPWSIANGAAAGIGSAIMTRLINPSRRRRRR